MTTPRVFSPCLPIRLACLTVGLLLASVASAGATQTWRLTRLGQGSEPAAWNRDLLGWGLIGDFETGGVFLWDRRTNRRTQLCSSLDTVYDSQFFWRGERLYWLRQPDTFMKSHLEILSMAPGEKRPRVELARELRPQGTFMMAGDRILWTEWAPTGDRWFVQTMLLTDAEPEQIAVFRSQIEEDPASDPLNRVCLTQKMIVWTEEDSTRVHVIPLDALGRLGTPAEFYAGGANWSGDALAADDDRAAWVTKDGCVRTWQLGEKAQHKVSGPPPGLSDGDFLFQSVAVSGDRIAWTSEGDGRHRVATWAVGSARPRVLAVYPYRASVSNPAAGGDRVAWAVSYEEADDGRRPPGFVATWSVRDPHVRKVITSTAVDSSDPGLAICRDSIAFHTGPGSENRLTWVARLTSRETPRRAVGTASRVTTSEGMIAPPSTPETSVGGPPSSAPQEVDESQQRPSRSAILLLSIAGLAGLLSLTIVARKRRP